MKDAILILFAIFLLSFGVFALFNTRKAQSIILNYVNRNFDNKKLSIDLGEKQILRKIESKEYIYILKFVSLIAILMGSVLSYAVYHRLMK